MNIDMVSWGCGYYE